MTCRLFGAEALPGPMPIHHKLNPQEQISVQLESIYNRFIKENAIVNVVCHFVSVQMCSALRKSYLYKFIYQLYIEFSNDDLIGIQVTSFKSLRIDDAIWCPTIRSPLCRLMVQSRMSVATPLPELISTFGQQHRKEQTSSDI